MYLPAEGERCVTVHLNTITDVAFDLTPDFVLDWRRHFEGRPDLKGHQLKDPRNWNKKLLPELRSVLTYVRKTTNCRLVRARGLARLSAWFAFGYTFSEVAGYTIEVQQQQDLWRTDAPPTSGLRVIPVNGSEGEILRTVARGSLRHQRHRVPGRGRRGHVVSMPTVHLGVTFDSADRRPGSRMSEESASDGGTCPRGQRFAAPLRKRWSATRRCCFTSDRSGVPVSSAIS